MNGIESIAAERQRQIEKEGWTPAHDNEHDEGDIALAAACYALPVAENYVECIEGMGPIMWPWAYKWWKPKDRRSDLVRAGALIAAEIDRLDRAALAITTEAVIVTDGDFPADHIFSGPIFMGTLQAPPLTPGPPGLILGARAIPPMTVREDEPK